VATVPGDRKSPKAITSFYNHLKMLINKFTYTINQAKLFNTICFDQSRGVYMAVRRSNGWHHEMVME
jgi:hypothetical protein